MQLKKSSPSWTIFMTHICCPPSSWFPLKLLLFFLQLFYKEEGLNDECPLCLLYIKDSDRAGVFYPVQEGDGFCRDLCSLVFSSGHPRFPPLAGTLHRGVSLLVGTAALWQPSWSRSSPFDLLKHEGSCNGTLSRAGASGLLCGCKAPSQELDKHPGEKKNTC